MKKAKRIISLILVCIMAVMCAVPVSAKSNECDVTVSMPEILYYIKDGLHNDMFVVDITIKDIAKYSNCTVIISYDSELVDYLRTETPAMSTPVKSQFEKTENSVT